MTAASRRTTYKTVFVFHRLRIARCRENFSLRFCRTAEINVAVSRTGRETLERISRAVTFARAFDPPIWSLRAECNKRIVMSLVFFLPWIENDRRININALIKYSKNTFFNAERKYARVVFLKRCRFHSSSIFFPLTHFCPSIYILVRS